MAWTRAELDQAFANFQSTVVECTRNGDWNAFADMFKVTFVISIVAAAVSMIFAWLIPKRKAPHRESTTSRPQE